MAKPPLGPPLSDLPEGTREKPRIEGERARAAAKIWSLSGSVAASRPGMVAAIRLGDMRSGSGKRISKPMAAMWWFHQAYT